MPEPGWLAGLAAEFRDDRVAAVSGRILSMAGANDDRDVLFGGQERVVVDRASPDWFGRTGFGGIGQGSNLAVRRAVLDSWKGFDERLGAGTRVGGMEEHHALFSLVDAGHRVVYTPAAMVLHPPSASDAELARRYVRDLTAAGFFVALLIAEQPRHRRRAARYALEALNGTPRHWRTQMLTAGSAVPRLRRATAPVHGAALYVLTRLRMQAAGRFVRNAGSKEARDDEPLTQQHALPSVAVVIPTSGKRAETLAVCIGRVLEDPAATEVVVAADVPPHEPLPVVPRDPRVKVFRVPAGAQSRR